MSLSGLLAIGYSGLTAQAANLEAVSENIANTQTTGYKRARVDFSTLISSHAPEGGIEAGGVDANTRNLVAEQGAIERTNNATDIAVSGDGFFVVSDDAGTDATMSFTRAGGFRAQEDGLLVNAAGAYLRAAPVDAAGNAAVSALSALEAVNINRITEMTAPTSAVTLAGRLAPDAAETVNIQVFDDAGAIRNLALDLNAVGAGVFNVTAAFTDGAAETVASGALAFAADGRLDRSASTFPFSFSTNSGQVIDLNVDGLTLGDGATRLTTADADGAALGVLTDISISRNGRITAEFSNGRTQDIYQLALATFTNAEGLEKSAASTFALTSAAGALSLEIPQSGRAGAVEANALEISTVDIGQEFSTLIESQRAYSANAQIITIAEELWRTLSQTARQPLGVS